MEKPPRSYGFGPQSQVVLLKAALCRPTAIYAYSSPTQAIRNIYSNVSFKCTSVIEMAAFRSAFEGAWPGDSTGSTSSAGSYSEDEGSKRLRVVGFPDFPEAELGPSEISRFSSCTLEERPKRQSSLAQQLNLYAFEQQTPKLRLINTKTTGNRRNRSGASGGPSTRAASGVLQPAASNPSRPSNPMEREVPGTLPTGNGLPDLRRGSSGSCAVNIPIG